MSSGRWTFTYEEPWWIARRTPEADANTVRAVETFFDPVANDPETIEELLNVWRDGCECFGIGFRTGTEGGAVERISDEEVELQDRYRQFDNVVISVDEFEDMLLTLKRASSEHGPKNPVVSPDEST
ncbi:hypothetical protein [Actinoallomurus sp. CA-150999]|uniref:hypothetical protein n=1 Tax=Actinoallomurus sp. CA-150999 TaxID=3239887 RepID=UPI003D8E752A